MPKATCKDCLYCVSDGCENICRFFPPVPTSYITDRDLPRVGHREWCGQFQPKDQPIQRGEFTLTREGD